MVWECDMLSRYNQMTGHWREDAAKEEVAERRKGHLAENVAAFEGGQQAKIFLSLPAKPSIPSRYTRLSDLPPVCYQGNIECPSVGNRIWDTHHSFMVVTEIDILLEESLSSIGMQSEGR